MHAGKLAHALDRLANTGRVLYVAAHPDDENTRLLAHLANQRHVHVWYLSMTRGGGGQNLIGPELAEMLDVVRTQELLAARRIDAASQRFTRMRDFGYSKSAEETLRIWDENEALADVVWVIRSLRPDVIITRFTEDPPNHGHHTASAILARQAFAAAADPNRFPDQLALGVEPWQADRLLRNVSHWRENPPPPEAIPIEINQYDPRLGVSYGELAALSRSQHKSQGFGAAGQRGSIVERFVHVAGTEPKSDVLEGIALDWRRFGEAGAAVAAALERARAGLERDHPEVAVPALLEARRALSALPEAPRVTDARRLLDEILVAAAGIHLRARADRATAAPGSQLEVTLEITARRPVATRLRKLAFPGQPAQAHDRNLAVDELVEMSSSVTIPAEATVSTPYWLTEAPAAGHQQVGQRDLVGQPVDRPALEVGVEIAVAESAISVDVPVVYTWTDRVHGERVRDFAVVPPATVTPLRGAVLVGPDLPGVVAMRIVAQEDGVRGFVSLPLPAGWTSTPVRKAVELAAVGDETTVRFAVQAPDGAAAVVARPQVEIGDDRWSYREDLVDYPHIPVQLVLRAASVKLVPARIELPSATVGYVAGSGDTVADDLRSVGVDVEPIDDQTLRSGDLSPYSAIVLGIRAYNTRAAVRGAQRRLMDYVEAGGTLVTQYNTHSDRAPLGTPIGPYPLQLGRGRVTDETAPIEAVDSEDPILLQPNQIGPADFEGWIQERGLYFAESWDDRYRTVFRIADPDEEPQAGSLLIADYGKGRFVYTGLAFFRQLPAGVPGAYRLFANLLAGETP